MMKTEADPLYKKFVKRVSEMNGMEVLHREIKADTIAFHLICARISHQSASEMKPAQWKLVLSGLGYSKMSRDTRGRVLTKMFRFEEIRDQFRRRKWRRQ